MTNASGERIDMFSEFAYDEDDNDETEEINGTIHYKHPYFFGKLRKFNGKNAFNLFDSAIDENEMTISMTSGHCGGCNFRVMVSDDDIKANTVQVYESDTTDADGTFHAKGSLKRDENGNVLCGRKPYQSAATPQDTQQDTINNEVWVALEKDLKTYGTIMPTRVVYGSSDTSIRPSTDDTFVILHTKLPQAYIDVAEQRLGKAIVKYMKDNNDEKFTFSIKFSRIYLAENPNVANLITENSLLYVKYNDKTYPLYVSSYSYKVSSNDALPEITVELKDEISVSQNALQNAITEVKGDFLDSFKNIDIRVVRHNHHRAVIVVYYLHMEDFVHFKEYFYRYYADEKAFNKAINYGLKEIGSLLGVDDLEYYAARHSWATIALNKVGIDKYTVHAALNHVDESMRVTDIYIERDFIHENKANAKVVKYVFSKS